MTEEAAVWNGEPALRAFLVPIETLEPFPGNPRRGDIPALRASLRRFGQLKPIVVESVDGRSRIVAGHQLVTAATEEDWTHVAAISHEFPDDEEARAYLLADNRTAELGSIDPEALAVQLAALQEFGGTGYTTEDREELERQLAALRDGLASSRVPTRVPSPAPPPPAVVPGVLLEIADADDRRDFTKRIALLRREWGLADTTAIVLRAVREAAMRS